MIRITVQRDSFTNFLHVNTQIFSGAMLHILVHVIGLMILCPVMQMQMHTLAACSMLLLDILLTVPVLFFFCLWSSVSPLLDWLAQHNMGRRDAAFPARTSVSDVNETMIMLFTLTCSFYSSVSFILFLNPEEAELVIGVR